MLFGQHGEHSAVPFVAAYEPGAQLEQYVMPYVAYVPTPHNVHAAALAVLFGMEPAGHTLQLAVQMTSA
jgi:hypothetical protein